jgi:ABC-2 type transport system permease protein
MRAIWAVFKREIGLYFRSPIAYAIAFAILIYIGLIFTGYIVSANQQAPALVTLAPQLMTIFLFIIAPILTMRLLAEESREGTLEVLMTLPMGDSAIVVGKFLAAWFFYSILLLLTLVHYYIWTEIGIPDQGEAFGAYLGAWLYGGSALAVCMIWSAVTEDQIVAAFLSAATVLIMYFSSYAADALASNPQATSLPAEIVNELGISAHYFDTMMRGILRAEDILYFVFFIAAALFITTRIIETRRWRA